MIGNDLSLEQPQQVIAPSQLDIRVLLEKRVTVLEMKIAEVPSKDDYYKLKEEFASTLDAMFQRAKAENAGNFAELKTEISKAHDDIRTINRALWVAICTLWFTTIAMCLSIFLELPWGKIISVILLENAAP